jgi:two-component sensor histidine kinase
MSQADLRTDPRPANSATPYQDELAAENVSLRLLLAQAEIDAQSLLATAGIDAREREAADKLQKLILEELHHRIKNARNRRRHRLAEPARPARSQARAACH